MTQTPLEELWVSGFVIMMHRSLRGFCGITVVVRLRLTVRCLTHVVIANLDDIVQALDSSDTIPTIYCEASQLHRIPPLSLDPVAEQVHSNSQALNALSSVIEGLEKKLSTFLVSCASPAAACGVQPAVSYSTVAPSPIATHSSSQWSLVQILLPRGLPLLTSVRAI